jgi:FtsP/CotA-like multicopper oxidase with cupredoxin domain
MPRVAGALSMIVSEGGSFSVTMLLSLLYALSPLVLSTSSARAEDWDPRSTALKPCGVGAPPRGHVIREFTSSDSAKRLTLTVRQDGDRLCYVWDGMAEAPVIRLRAGDRLALTLKNEITDPVAIADFIPLGRLEKRNAPVPLEEGFYPVVPGMHHAATGITNLHVHGFAVPPVAPADEVLRTCADPQTGGVRCGRHEIAYVYDVPKTMPTGLYWYHPHVHGETQAQVEMGLLGAIVVEGPDDDRRHAAGIEDRVLLIGQTQDPAKSKARETSQTLPEMHAHAEAKPPAWAGSATKIDTAHEVPCGQEESERLTLNGTLVRDGEGPDDSLAHFEIPGGGKQLWRVANGADETYLDLALVDESGAALPIEIVARDGAPIADDSGSLRPERTDKPQLVPPAGRIEFVIDAPRPNSKAYFVSHAVDTGCAGDKVPERQLAAITAGPADPAQLGKHQSRAEAAALGRSVNLFSGLLARRTERRRVIAFAEYPRPGAVDENDFYIVERKPGAELRPFGMNEPPAITVHAGTTEEWVIENWTRELHAFHIHQLHFRVLEINGTRMRNPPLLDVVNIPVAMPDRLRPERSLAPGRVRIKLWFPAGLAGDIPFHCHLLEHEDNGMMAVIRVLPGERRNRHASSVPKPAAARGKTPLSP